MSGKEISIITFSEKFDKKDLDDSEYNKLIEAIHVHGYRGASKKRHNGVVPIRPVDKKLFKDLDKTMEKETNEIKNRYKKCVKIKIVAHVPSGKRLVGYMYNIKETNSYGLFIVTTSHY